jgi:hypothetical protein
MRFKPLCRRPWSLRVGAPWTRTREAAWAVWRPDQERSPSGWTTWSTWPGRAVFAFRTSSVISDGTGRLFDIILKRLAEMVIADLPDEEADDGT